LKINENIWKDRLPLWVIEHVKTGELLGTRGRASDVETYFGADIPLMFVTLRGAEAGWFKHCCDQGYLQRGVSLGGIGRRFEAGENHVLMPDVRALEVTMQPKRFSHIVYKENPDAL